MDGMEDSNKALCICDKARSVNRDGDHALESIKMKKQKYTRVLSSMATQNA